MQQRPVVDVSSVDNDYNYALLVNDVVVGLYHSLHQAVCRGRSLCPQPMYWAIYNLKSGRAVSPKVESN